MIVMHRLGQSEPFQLNPDLIVTVEAHPDTVVTLATGTKIVVTESPDEVSEAVRDWRVSIVNEAWRARRAPAEASDGALV
jgi:flagellar protein FlbD